MLELLFEKCSFVVVITLGVTYFYRLPNYINIWYYDILVNPLILAVALNWLFINNSIGTAFIRKILNLSEDNHIHLLNNMFIIYAVISVVIYIFFYLIDTKYYPLSSNDIWFYIMWIVNIMLTLCFMRIFGYFDIIYECRVYIKFGIFLLFIVALSFGISIYNLYHPHDNIKSYYLSSEINKIGVVKAYLDENRTYIQSKNDQNNLKKLKVVNVGRNDAVICFDFENLGLSEGAYVLKYSVNGREYSKEIYYIVNEVKK